jgi:acetyl-CoA carboxylase biotin carboxyl carrier protein
VDAPDREQGTAAGEVDTDALLALIDRLEELLVRSDLSELEVEADGTALVLRTPAALAPAGGVAPLVVAPAPAAAPIAEEAPDEDPGSRQAVLAPLTGVFYEAPSPDAAPYVREGSEIHVGQVIGLIEAMKLFNEIKSDAAGRVTRIVARSGQLVKAKQPLIEVEPS